MAETSVTQVAELQLVVFRLARELYGVDIAKVHEIIRMQAITKVPRAPAYVEGVINLRGVVIPVVDLRKRFGLDVSDHDKDSRIVVVDMGDQTIGMVVDAVTEVLRIAGESVEPPSSAITSVEAEYMSGIAKLEGMLIIMLDMDKVLTKKDTSAIRETVQERQPAEAGAR